MEKVLVRTFLIIILDDSDGGGSRNILEKTLPLNAFIVKVKFLCVTMALLELTTKKDDFIILSSYVLLHFFVTFTPICQENHPFSYTFYIITPKENKHPDN